ncbi:pilus assembly protein [Vibrio sp. JC009]|uniref:TadE/TadG family type IV pilus assembly protein n=1 Tax=Vibrio sp. JC009 TaxID=2912314 RepID=UPI0023B0D5DB|nr:TadE/TadG family type IV pilus assembly protein [Vibrio sp. JC009]WED24814.1 pilus assembly protein [Vibrio sp. JC009]
MHKLNYQSRNSELKGFASVELTLVLPVLLLLMLAIYELTNIIQANSITINLGREIANMTSRSPQSSTDDPDYIQDIMDIVATTSGSLDFTTDGVIYVSKVVGQGTTANPYRAPYIQAQYKWNRSGINEPSITWSNCNSWVSGECTSPNLDPSNENNRIVISNFPVHGGEVAGYGSGEKQLSAGKVIYVVEVIYRYTPITTFFLKHSIMLSEETYM